MDDKIERVLGRELTDFRPSIVRISGFADFLERHANVLHRGFNETAPRGFFTARRQVELIKTHKASIRLPYQSDMEQYKLADYWKYPDEEKIKLESYAPGGDCEDRALFCHERLRIKYEWPAKYMRLVLVRIRSTRQWHILLHIHLYKMDVVLDSRMATPMLWDDVTALYNWRQGLDPADYLT